MTTTRDGLGEALLGITSAALRVDGLLLDMDSDEGDD